MKTSIILIITLIFGILMCGSVSAANIPTQNVGASDSYNGDTFNISDDNYNYYFNSEGLLKSEVVGSGDTLKLSGDFYNKNMTINAPVNLIGYETTLHNGTIQIIAEGSGTTVSHINIENSNQKGIIIFESENNTIENNNIVVNEDQESYALYLHDSRNNRIISNNLTTTGDYITYGILLYESYSNEIISNQVNVIGTDVPLPFHSSITINPDIGTVSEIFPTYGILLLFSSDNKITDNDVFMTSGFTTPMTPTRDCMNSMVGIDIYYDSHNNTVTYNNIILNGNNPYSYGLGVLGSVWGTNNTSAENNVFSYNNINVNGSHFATGFIAGLNSFDTILTDNIINASANTFSYGITLEASTSSTVSRNTVTTRANVNYIMELFASDNNIIDENELYGSGNYTLGIGTYNSENNNINHNTITTIGDNSTPHIPNSDSIPSSNEGIKLYQNSNQNTLEYNIINSYDVYAINSVGSSQNIIRYNFLFSDNGNNQGNYAVNSDSKDTVSGNYGIPVADFTATTTTGNSSLHVIFNNQSTDATSYAWDFDGNGTVDSTETNPAWTYNTPGTYTVKLTVNNVGGIDEETKTGYITVNKSDESDLLVKELKVTNCPYLNYSLIEITITNIGLKTAGLFDVTLYDNGTKVGEQYSLWLASDSTRTLYFIWSPSTIGDHNLQAIIDNKNNIQESNENNNTINQLVDNRPDLSPIELKTNILPLNYCYTTVEVTNNGENLTEFYDVTLYDNGTQIGQQKIYGIKKGEIKTATFLFKLTKNTTHNLQATTDTQNTIPETNENNNTINKTIT